MPIAMQLLLVTILLCATGSGDAGQSGKGRGGGMQSQQSYGGQQSHGGGRQPSYGQSAVRSTLHFPSLKNSSVKKKQQLFSFHRRRCNTELLRKEAKAKAKAKAKVTSNKW